MNKEFFHCLLVLIPENVGRIMHAPCDQFVYFDHVVQNPFLLLKYMPNWQKIA